MATNNFIRKLGTEYLARTAGAGRTETATEEDADINEDNSPSHLELLRHRRGRHQKLRVCILTDADPHGILIAHTYIKHIGSVCNVTWLTASLWKRRESLCLPSGSLLPLRPDEKRVATCALRRWQAEISAMMKSDNATATININGADADTTATTAGTSVAEGDEAVFRMRILLRKVMEDMMASNEKFELEALSCCDQTQVQMHQSSQGKDVQQSNGGNHDIELGLFEHVSYLLRTCRHRHQR